MNRSFIYISPLLVIMLVLWAPKANAAMVETCLAPLPPSVNVNVREGQASFDMDQNSAQLEAFKSAMREGHVPSVYHAKDIAQNAGDILGVTVGNFSADYSLGFKYGEEIASDKVCVSLSNINVQLTFSPSVYVAREFKDQDCWFSQIFGHEAKHVAIDRAITQKYKSQIEDMLGFAFVVPSDYSSGRVSHDEMMVMELILDNMVDDTLGVVLGSLIRERNLEQAAIDNIDEYIRIAQACPAVGVPQAIPTPLPAILNQ